MKRSYRSFIEKAIFALTLLFALDRLLKLAAVIHFFRRSSPPQPETWPTVTLLQPITRGANGLADSLRARAQLDYPVVIQHLFICDAHDTGSQALVRTLLAEFPVLQAEIILVEPDKHAGKRAYALEFRGFNLCHDAHTHQRACLRFSPRDLSRYRWAEWPGNADRRRVRDCPARQALRV